LESRRVDLEVAEIAMTRMDGIEIPVTMPAANQGFDARREGFRSGIEDYLNKTVKYGELGWRHKALVRRTAHVAEERVREGDESGDAGRAAPVARYAPVSGAKPLNLTF